MCGVVGGHLMPHTLVKMLSRIQHRGFVSAGLATNHWFWRVNGSVKDLTTKHGKEFHGDLGIGHVRYTTDPDSPPQPLVSLHSDVLEAFCFNGQVEDGDTVRVRQAVRDDDFQRVCGAYCYAYLDPELRTVRAGRDAFGFHPLYYSPQLRCVASEPCVAPTMDWEPIPPGCEVRCDTGVIRRFLPQKPARCFFEWVYFSSVESEFDGLSVYEIRRRLGIRLAEREEVAADVVVPVPDSGIAASEAMAEVLGLPCRAGMYRDRYAERTFINETGFGDKYRVIPEALFGKVLLVDDSIVRGNTLNHLVPILKRYCDEVHVRVTCPKITDACRYGIRIGGKGAHDIPSADSVRFLEVNDLDWTGGLCKACVTGEYPDELEDNRCDVQQLGYRI